jgi:hypothetical protein
LDNFVLCPRERFPGIYVVTPILRQPSPSKLKS